jgi:hypothetical protein
VVVLVKDRAVIVRCAKRNNHEYQMIPDFTAGMSVEFVGADETFLLESLILAQDERWRRA